MSVKHEAAGPRSWSVLVLLCIAQFMVILDVTVVNVALPSIGDQLGFAAQDLQWVVSAYVLFTGGLLLLGGRMADLLGRRRVFLAGLVIFTAASLASGLATSPAALIVARALQGVGAALLSPAALSIITTTYSGAQRTAALSVWGTIGAGGAGAGVLLGGLLTSWLSWEAIFFINVPVGAGAALFAHRLVPGSAARVGALRELDLPGALTVVAGLVVLVYAIEGATRHGWGSTRTLVLLALSGGLLALFATVERRATHALLPPATWRLRSLVSSAIVMLAATGILVGAFFINSIYLQHAMAASALETGLAFVPLVLAIGLAAHAGAHLLARGGARVVVVSGLVLIAAGEVLLTGVPKDANYARDLLPGYVLLGIGVGLAFVAVSVTAMAEIHDEAAGLASGLMTTAHEIGAALGVAICSVVALGGGISAAEALADGYADAALTSAAVAGALATFALVAMPAYRPARSQRVAMH